MKIQANIEIDINKLQNNVQKLFKKFKNYDYKIIDLRNNFFGMGIYLVNVFESLGFNYGYVTNIKEGLRVRKYNQTLPILIKESVSDENIYDAINNNFTLTISNLNNLQDISAISFKDDLKVHLLIDNGSNNEGLKSFSEIKKAIEIINTCPHLVLEGIYTEITTYGLEDNFYYEQMANFLKMIEPIKSSELIIHANEPIMYHAASRTINGLKLDLAVLGVTEQFTKYNNLKVKKINKLYGSKAFNELVLNLDFAWALKGQVKSISYVAKNTLVGRNFIAKEDFRLALVNIGHKDGITKALKVVVINNKAYDIITDSLDELYIKIDDDVKIGDTVFVISEYNNFGNVLLNLKTNRYYLMSIINNDLPRIYIEDDEEKEIDYYE